MKSISVLDLQLIPELSHLNIFELIHPDNDVLTAPFLHEIGFDLDRGVEVVCSHHRRLNRQAATSFVFVGEVRCDREFRLSAFCSVEDRLIMAGKSDQSLARELASMSCVAQSSYGVTFALEGEEQYEHYHEREEIDRIESELEALEAVLNNIRPEQRRKDGSLKKLREYSAPETFEKPRKRKDNRSTLKHRESRELKREQA